MQTSLLEETVARMKIRSTEDSKIENKIEKWDALSRSFFALA